MILNFRLLFGPTVSCLILTTQSSSAAPHTKQEKPMAVPELRSTLGVSPDGQWAVATDPQATDVFHWYLMPTFGKMRPFSIPASRFQNGIDDMALIGDVHPWMADNRHWVLVSDGGHGLLYATIFDRMRPDRWRRVEVKLPPQEKRIPNLMHRLNAPTYLVGFTPAGAAVVGSGDDNAADRSVTLYEFALDRPQVTAKARRVSLPVPAFPLPTLSPDGKSLVWRVVNQGSAGRRMEIWVSDRNGACWRTAGYADPQDGRGDYPSALQWTPDSKHLSVIVGSGLSTPYDMYIIPAP
jgi:hypothetical protein